MRAFTNFFALVLTLLFACQVLAGPVLEARQNSSSSTATASSSSSSTSAYNAATDTASGTPAGVGTGSSGSGEGSSGQNSISPGSAAVARFAVPASLLGVSSFGAILLAL